MLFLLRYRKKNLASCRSKAGKERVILIASFDICEYDEKYFF
jgi:hypothetical protein